MLQERHLLVVERRPARGARRGGSRARRPDLGRRRRGRRLGLDLRERPVRQGARTRGAAD
eukprot:2756059-Prymnesium_polylepis.1